MNSLDLGSNQASNYGSADQSIMLNIDHIEEIANKESADLNFNLANLKKVDKQKLKQDNEYKTSCPLNIGIKRWNDPHFNYFEPTQENLSDSRFEDDDISKIIIHDQFDGNEDTARSNQNNIILDNISHLNIRRLSTAEFKKEHETKAKGNYIESPFNPKNNFRKHDSFCLAITKKSVDDVFETKYCQILKKNKFMKDQSNLITSKKQETIKNLHTIAETNQNEGKAHIKNLCDNPKFRELFKVLEIKTEEKTSQLSPIKLATISKDETIGHSKLSIILNEFTGVFDNFKKLNRMTIDAASKPKVKDDYIDNLYQLKTKELKFKQRLNCKELKENQKSLKANNLCRQSLNFDSKERFKQFSQESQTTFLKDEEYASANKSLKVLQLTMISSLESNSPKIISSKHHYLNKPRQDNANYISPLNSKRKYNNSLAKDRKTLLID